jgi:steroid delta-isomerase-like uncharacterized protein
VLEYRKISLSPETIERRENSMSVESNKEFARRWFATDLKTFKEMIAENKRDEWFAPGFVFHSSAGNLDMNAYIPFMADYFNPFPDFKFEVLDLIGEKDKVVARYITTGTHKLAYRGIPASGKRINVNCMMILRLSEGKLAEAWSIVDSLTMLTQIGAIPAPRK